MKGIQIIVVLVAVSAIAACGTFGESQSSVAPEGEPAQPASRETPAETVASVTPAPVTTLRRPLDDLDSLLRYYQHLKKLSAAELVREHEQARRTYAATPSEYNRLRLAMLLSLPNVSFRNDANALELLDPTVRNHTEGLYGLAFLLASYIQERRRLDGSIQGLQQHVQDLQHKLDALRSLERSMSERGPAGGKKR